MNQNETQAASQENDSADAAAAATEVEKTTIRPDLNRYVRDKSGKGKRTHRTDDFVARTLAGKEVEAIKAGATQLGIDVAKWEHLNPGQQRMLIGNALRHRLQDKKAPLEESAITAVYGEPVEPYDAEKAAAAKAAAEAAKAAGTPEPAAEGQGETLPSGKPKKTVVKKATAA